MPYEEVAHAPVVLPARVRNPDYPAGRSRRRCTCRRGTERRRTLAAGAGTRLNFGPVFVCSFGRCIQCFETEDRL